MAIVFDPAKRDRTLAERGLDFLRYGEVFDGPHLTIEDDRKNYGETRYFTVGYLDQASSWPSGRHAETTFASSA